MVWHLFCSFLKKWCGTIWHNGTFSLKSAVPHLFRHPWNPSIKITHGAPVNSFCYVCIVQRKKAMKKLDRILQYFVILPLFFNTLNPIPSKFLVLNPGNFIIPVALIILGIWTTVFWGELPISRKSLKIEKSLILALCFQKLSHLAKWGVLL